MARRRSLRRRLIKRVSVTDALPFDPLEVGPLDLLGSWYRRLAAWVDENSTVVIGASVGLIIGLAYVGVSIPRLPSWALVGFATVVIATPSAVVVGIRLGRWLYEPGNVLIAEQNPQSGDIVLYLISPDQFRNMRVVNQNGKPRERTDLIEILINGRRAYEVDTYHPEDNVAVTSWQAGVSNSEMRRQKTVIDRVKTSLEQEGDKAHALLAHYPEIVRRQTREVIHEILAVVEDVEIPGDKQLHERLTAQLEADDPAEALLAGPGDVEGSTGEPQNGDGSGGDGTAVLSLEGDVSDLMERFAEEDPSHD